MKNKSKDLIFARVTSNFFDWVTKSSYDTPISNFSSGISLYELPNFSLTHRAIAK